MSLIKSWLFVSGEAAINDIALTSSGYGLFSAAGDKVRIWDLRKFHSIGKLSGGHQVIKIQLRRMWSIIFGISAHNQITLYVYENIPILFPRLRWCAWQPANWTLAGSEVEVSPPVAVESPEEAVENFQWTLIRTTTSSQAPRTTTSRYPFQVLLYILNRSTYKWPGGASLKKRRSNINMEIPRLVFANPWKVWCIMKTWWLLECLSW